jgi:hypothetical protein
MAFAGCIAAGILSNHCGSTESPGSARSNDSFEDAGGDGGVLGCGINPDGQEDCVSDCVNDPVTNQLFCASWDDGGIPTTAERLTPERGAYSNACFGACGAGCNRCTQTGGVNVCQCSTACSWHDQCYQNAWNNPVGTRVCDFFCIKWYGWAACLGGLAGHGTSACCFANGNPVPCPTTATSTTVP